MKKILILQPVRPHHRAAIEGAGQGFDLVFGQDLTSDQRAAVLPQAVAIFGEPSMEKLRQATSLRWLQMTWAGADRYTKNPGFPAHVALTIATGAYGAVISEYILGALLAVHRRSFDYKIQQENRQWVELPVASMEGKTALILGAGDIGTETAKRLQAFGVRTLGVARTIGATRPYFEEIHTLADLDQLLPTADMVISCLPNTAETVGLLDIQRLFTMKKTAILVNVGRGNLMPEGDLETVLTAGHLQAVALDVFPQEPLPEHHPLWQMKNVHITPHVAGVGFGHAHQTEDKIVEIFCENLRRFAQEQPLKNQVDFDLGYGVK